MQTRLAWRSAVVVAAVTGLLASLQALDLRIDAPATMFGINSYWMLNIALCFWGFTAGMLHLGSGRTRMYAALVGLILGAVIFTAVALSRSDADNNMLPPAIVINILLGVALFGAGTGMSALLGRLVRARGNRQ